MIRYRCTNPWCLDSWHYSSRCPRDVPADPPRRFTQAELAAGRKLREAVEAGDFDLRRTPRYMVERDQARAENAKPGPGWGWLLVLAPVAVLLTVVMLALVLVH